MRNRRADDVLARSLVRGRLSTISRSLDRLLDASSSQVAAVRTQLVQRTVDCLVSDCEAGTKKQRPTSANSCTSCFAAATASAVPVMARVKTDVAGSFVNDSLTSWVPVREEMVTPSIKIVSVDDLGAESNKTDLVPAARTAFDLTARRLVQKRHQRDADRTRTKITHSRSLEPPSSAPGPSRDRPFPSDLSEPASSTPAWTWSPEASP